MFKFITAKFFAAAAAAAVISGAAAYSTFAAEGDYVVVLKNEPRIMLSDASHGIVSRNGRVVVVESYMDALALAPASEIACIFEDGIAYLLDDESTDEPEVESTDEPENDPTDEPETESTDEPEAEPTDEPEIEPTDKPEIPDGPPVNDPSYNKQWALEAINASYAWAKGFTGKGVKVGIVDSGMKRPSHADLPIPSLYLNAMRNATDYSDYSDEYGHGTKVAGIIGATTNNGIGIAGIAYDAELVPIKVADAKSLYISDMISGFERAVDLGCQVINMSLGFTKKDISDITSIGTRIQNAANKGVLVVAAAGNDGTSEYQYPASYDCVVSVASMGNVLSKLLPSTFSQHNDKVTITAPGYQIYSTNNSGTYGYYDGTSFSAPMVTAAAAIAKQINPLITYNEFTEALIATSKDIYTEGYDEYTGYGMLDLQALTDYLAKDAPFITPSPEPTATPEPIITPEPTATPKPEASELTYDGDRYMLTAVHEPFSSQVRIIAAFYEGDRLSAIKSTYGIDGNEVNRIPCQTDAEITRAEFFGWDFSDKENPVPVSDKQVVCMSE